MNLLILALALGLSIPLHADNPAAPAPLSASAESTASAASKALADKAALSEDASVSVRLYRQAMRTDRGGDAGSSAALDLARLEYARGRPAQALSALEEAEAWPRSESVQPEWLYWHGQSLLALKRWVRAEQDFRQLVGVWPGNARIDAALLGEADCEAALGDRQHAEESYGTLAADGGAFAAQALWGLGALRLDEGRDDEAREAFERLRTDYPASFEAREAGRKLGDIAARARSAPPARVLGSKGRWNVQVGAYSKTRWADALADQLRRHHFRAKVQRKDLDGRLLYLVKVGPYASRADAAAAALVLHSREKLPFSLVEE